MEPAAAPRAAMEAKVHKTPPQEVLDILKDLVFKDPDMLVLVQWLKEEGFDPGCGVLRASVACARGACVGWCCAGTRRQSRDGRQSTPGARGQVRQKRAGSCPSAQQRRSCPCVAAPDGALNARFSTDACVAPTYELNAAALQPPPATPGR